MDNLVYIPSNDELKKFTIEHIEYLYTDGLKRRSVVASEMEFGRLRDRHFITKTFGNEFPNGVHADRMNGNTGGLSYNDYYAEWREKVLGALSSSTLPNILRLTFLGVPELLVEKKYRDVYADTIMEVALKTFDNALEKLLDIIAMLPDDNKTEPETVSTSHGVFSITISGAVIKNGRRIKLPAQQSRLMARLVQEHGKALSRAECIDTIWNEDNATDGYLDNPKHTPQHVNKTISNLVNKLNENLREEADRKQYIRKAPDGDGYYLSD